MLQCGLCLTLVFRYRIQKRKVESQCNPLVPPLKTSTEAKEASPPQKLTAEAPSLVKCISMHIYFCTSD